MTREALKRTTSLAVAGAFAVALAGSAVAAPLSVAGNTATGDHALIQPVVYHHHYRHHYRHYGAGAAVAGTALGLIGGAIAASQYHPYYGYGYGPGPYYGGYYGGYGYGPNGAQGWW